MRLTFTRDFAWSPSVAVTLRYQPGDVCDVPRDCADAALAAGAAHESPAKGKAVPAAPDTAPITKE
jgi:hypothetical protein